MIEWLADPERSASVAAIGFLISLLGFPLTLLGLFLTYRQAVDARYSAERSERELERFSKKKDRSEAVQYLHRASQNLEVASVLIEAEQWKQASSAYDEARRGLQTVLGMSVGVKRESNRELGLICDHLSAFSNSVDDATDGKGNFPSRSSVKATIRRNSDILTRIQRELHEGLT